MADSQGSQADKTHLRDLWADYRVSPYVLPSLPFLSPITSSNLEFVFGAFSFCFQIDHFHSTHMSTFAVLKY